MSVWLKEDNRDIADKIILFVISPFLAFLYSLQRIKTKSSYIVFFLFSVCFGLSFTVDSGKSELIKLDGASYRERFEAYRNVGSQEYYSGLKEFFSFDEGAKDYYFDTVAFYVSRITGNYHVMFMIFAAIFAFFSLKSFKFLTSEDNFNTTLASFILAYLFMINQIFNINGVRFWTAAWIAVYAVFQIFKNGNKKYFFLTLITPFFHGSYWIFIGVLLLAYFFKRYEKLWTVLFIISFFVSNISVEMARGIIDALPPFLGKMALSYTDQEYIEMRNAAGTGFWWVNELFRYLVMIYINVTVFLFINNRIQITSNPKTKNLFAFLLVWMTFANFTMPIPSLGARFVQLSYPLIAYIWLVNFKDVKYQLYLYLIPFVFLYNIYRQGVYYNTVLDPYFYISSPIFLVLKYL